MRLKLGSLFDGSGTAPLAATMCGIVPVWASEIEKYPIAVTRARFPNMKHLGDITIINGATVEPVDIICGGSPCQDLSIAGKRTGLHEGERSHLFFDMMRIIKQMREATNGKYPRYCIWENVPGAFTSNKGYDFLAVLKAFAQIADPDVHVPEPKKRGGKLAWKRAGEMVGSGWSVAWRTVDAQYWGVPQRRRRIYLVADLTGERAGKILFEREGMSGNFEPCGEAQEGATDNVEGGTGGSGRAWLSASFMGGQGPKAGGLGYAEEVAPTLKAAPSGTNTVPDVVYAINDKATRNRSGGSTRHDDGAGNGLGVQDDGAMYTLDTASRHAVCYPETARCLTARHDGSPCADRGPDVVVYRHIKDGVAVADKVSSTLRARTPRDRSDICVYDTTQITSPANSSKPVIGDPYHTLSANQHPPLLIHPRIAGSLCATSHPGGVTGQDAFNDMLPVLTSGKPPRKYIVRRLTPLECCRLQGFPDDYLDGVDGSDSAKYRLWGNGMALPNMLHVMRGIARISIANELDGR